jgi:hypothetical protein
LLSLTRSWRHETPKSVKAARGAARGNAGVGGRTIRIEITGESRSADGERSFTIDEADEAAFKVEWDGCTIYLPCYSGSE